MPYEIQAPTVMGSDFLLEAGRDLMRWWNEQGAELPEPGERFRRWWEGAHRELEAGWFGPGLARGDSILARLQAYAEEARAWWRTGQSDTGPPPVLLDPEPLVDSEPLQAAASGLWALAAIGAVAALFWFRRR